LSAPPFSMRRGLTNIPLQIFLFCSITVFAQVRPAGVAGSFYPANKEELAHTVDAVIAKVQQPTISDPIVALVSPHAGYQYSGPVAACSYALLKGRSYKRVVIIAPSHFESFPFSSIYDGDAYETPLGRVPIDKVFARKLAAQGRSLKLSLRGHVPAEGQSEHAVEVELPFLQRTLRNFQIVPIVMGDQSYDASRVLGVALAKLIHDSNTLILVSSDLSHYHTYADASAMDHKTLQAVQEWDYLSLSRNLEARTWEACGGGPIVAAMIAAERLGANEARLLRYANSGDTTNDKTRVVGYGAIAFLKSPKQAETQQPFSLSEQDKRELLALARNSVESAVRDHKLYEFSPSVSPTLLQDRAAFVTITEHGELRGCIGYVSAMKPLENTVRDVAAMAALKDDRFAPVTESELKNLHYEVSVLSPFRRATNPSQIHVGRNGLLLKQGQYEGVLLPQVPVDEHWTLPTFLQQVSLKAGLLPDAWRDPNTDLFMFTAVIFSDSSFFH
jgi:MEMO1 family protein